MEEEVNISDENLEKIKSVDFAPIPRHKALIINQYTETPQKECIVLDGQEDEETKEKKPEITNMEDLFDYYKPAITIKLGDKDADVIQLRDLNNFLPEGEDGFINQSVELSSNQAQVELLKNFSTIITDDDDVFDALNDEKARAALKKAAELFNQILA